MQNSYKMPNSYNKKEILILFNSIPYFLNYFNTKGVTGSFALREIPFQLKIIRRVTRLLGLSQVYWLDSWKKKIVSYDTIIIFAPVEEIDVFSFIKKTNPEARIIYWYWNPLIRTIKIDNKLLEGVEIWSFDPRDCENYNLKFNTTFYFKNIVLPVMDIQYDVIFVGMDKGRKVLLDEIHERLVGMELITIFRVIDSIKNQIPYASYLKLLAGSRVILDIIPKGQSGLTIRTMESIFFGKKLITTDETIVYQKFYNKQNIFVLGKDDEFQLKEFVSSPFIKIDDSVKLEYDLPAWLNRFYQ